MGGIWLPQESVCMVVRVCLRNFLDLCLLLLILVCYLLFLRSTVYCFVVVDVVVCVCLVCCYCIWCFLLG